MDMQLELTTPVIAKRGAAWKKACATGAAALVVGCVAVSRVGNTATFDLIRSGTSNPQPAPQLPAGWNALAEKIKAHTGGDGSDTANAFTRAKVADCPAAPADEDKPDKIKRKTCMDAIIKKINAVKIADLTTVKLSVAGDISSVENYKTNVQSRLDTDFGSLPDEEKPDEDSAIISALTRLTEATVTVFKKPLLCQGLDAECVGDKTADVCKTKLDEVLKAAIPRTTLDLAKKYGVTKLHKENGLKAEKCAISIAKALEHLSSKDKVKYGPETAFYQDTAKYGKSLDHFLSSGSLGMIIGAIILCVVALGGGAYYFYMQQQKKKEVKVVDGQ